MNLIANRLLLVTAIALGTGIPLTDITSSYAAVNKPSVSTNLDAPGKINFAKITTTFTAKIQSALCGSSGKKFIRKTYTDSLSVGTKPPQRELEPLTCGSNIAKANTKNTTNLAAINGNKNIFKGALVTNASINRSILGNSSVFASSRSQLSLETKVAPQIRVSGKYSDARTAYFHDANPKSFSSTDTQISYYIRQDQPPQNQRQLNSSITGFLFKSQSELDGIFNWDDIAIDFSGVENGTFSVEWGDVVDRRGRLFLELEKGCVIRSVDTEDFEGWLPAIGSCSPIVLTNELPNFGFDFKYDFGTFDRPVEFGIGISNNSVAAPEPITILGTLTALGFGSLFKKKYSKKNKR